MMNYRPTTISTKNIYFTPGMLIVDGDDQNRMVFSRFLETQRYRVWEAGNLVEAKKVLDNFHVDLVFLSINFGYDGVISLLSWIREKLQQSSVIIITTRKSVDAFDECSTLGADDYISYPLDFTNVVTVVHRALDLRRNRSDNQSKMENSEISSIAGYEIRGILGKGNMGTVYLVEKQLHGVRRNYALKILMRPEGEGEERCRELLERFLREAEMAAKLIHPNIVRIIDFGLAEENRVPYIVMDLIKGATLRRILGGEWSLDRIEKVKIVRQVAFALTKIHSHGICHRDIKPENIMLNLRGKVKVTDFGIARLPNSQLTQSFKIMGTPAYMAPESFSSALVDYRADIFSLGVVAYELLLNQKPFVSDTIDGYRKAILNKSPVAPRKLNPDFPLELQEILAKALKKDSASRYKAAAEMVLDLDEYLNGLEEDNGTEILDFAEYFSESPDMEEHRTQNLKGYETKDDWR